MGPFLIPPLLQGALLWAVTLSYSPFLLLFMNRALRAIGPALLAMMLVTVGGAFALLVAASTPVGLKLTLDATTALHLPPNQSLWFVAAVGGLAVSPLAWGPGITAAQRLCREVGE